MANFKDIVASARSEHDRKAAEESEHNTIAQNKRKDFLDRSKGLLEDWVVPILSDAIAAFRDEGIHAEIERQYDVENRAIKVKPRLIFRCSGPPRESDGYRFPCSQYFFSADATTVYVGAGDEIQSNATKDIGKIASADQAGEIAGKVVAEAATDYFARLKEYARIYSVRSR